jgi:hypothetical protein
MALRIHAGPPRFDGVPFISAPASVDGLRVRCHARCISRPELPHHRHIAGSSWLIHRPMARLPTNTQEEANWSP